MTETEAETTVTPEQAEKLWKTYSFIAELAKAGGDANGNIWDQDYWMFSVGDEWMTIGTVIHRGNVCNTAMCYAGWYAVLDGQKLRYGGGGSAYIEGTDLSLREWVARDASLGRWSADLFCGHNDLETIRGLLVEITGRDA